MTKISAPGKLFLSGEWAVLEVGNPGIVTAVNKRVYSEIQESEKILVSIDDFGIKDAVFCWDGKDLVPEKEVSEQATKFLRKSISTALIFLKEQGIQARNFKIRTWGEGTHVEIAGERKKVGFGSSAASVVAIVKSILDFHGFDATKEQIFKLSALVHYFAQGKVGSAFDVAASTFGGVFVYRRFDSSWLVKEMESGKPVSEVVSSKWPGFEVEELEIPEGFELLIGWTKGSASTSAMVKQLNAWASENQEEYKKSYDSIANLVRELIPAWKSKDSPKILELLKRNETLLAELGKSSGVNIETPELRTLAEKANQSGGAGKLSGAGGGDCGIAVSFDKETSERIRLAWKEAELYLIDATVDKEGVKAC